ERPRPTHRDVSIRSPDCSVLLHKESGNRLRPETEKSMLAEAPGLAGSSPLLAGTAGSLGADCRGYTGSSPDCNDTRRFEENRPRASRARRSPDAPLLPPQQTASRFVEAFPRPRSDCRGAADSSDSWGWSSMPSADAQSPPPAGVVPGPDPAVASTPVPGCA